MPETEPRVLIVTPSEDSRNSKWNTLLREVLQELGLKTMYTDPERLARRVINPDICAVVIERFTPDETIDMLREVKRISPATLIISANTILDFQDARAIFRAGAADCIEITLVRDDLLKSLQETILPPRPTP